MTPLVIMGGSDASDILITTETRRVARCLRFVVRVNIGASSGSVAN